MWYGATFQRCLAVIGEDRCPLLHIVHPLVLGRSLPLFQRGLVLHSSPSWSYTFFVALMDTTLQTEEPYSRQESVGVAVSPSTSIASQSSAYCAPPFPRPFPARSPTFLRQ